MTQYTLRPYHNDDHEDEAELVLRLSWPVTSHVEEHCTHQQAHEHSVAKDHLWYARFIYTMHQYKSVLEYDQSSRQVIHTKHHVANYGLNYAHLLHSTLSDSVHG